MDENVNAARGLATPPASVRAIVSWLEAAASGTATKPRGSSNLAATVGHKPKSAAGSPAVPSAVTSPTVPSPPSTAPLRGRCLPMQQKQQPQQQQKQQKQPPPQKQKQKQKQNDDDNDPFISKRPVCRQHSSSSTTTTSTSSTATATTTTTATASSSSTPSNSTSEDASLAPARRLDGAVTGHRKMSKDWPHCHHLDNHHHKTSSLQRLDEVMRDLAWFSEPDAHYDHSCEKQEGLLGGVAQRRPRQEVDAFWYSVRRYLDVPDEELYT